MAVKVPKPEVADDLSKLLATLKQAASEVAQGADTPDEKDAVAEGKKSGSTVADASLVTADQNNSNAQPVLEVGDDPSKAKDGPKVKKNTANGSEEIHQSGENMTIKQASSLADELDALDQKLLHLAAAEVVAELAVLHQAEMEEQAISEAVPELQEALGVDEETAMAIAEGVLSGEVPQEDLIEAIEQTQNLGAISEATGAAPEEVMAFAEQIGQAAEESGRPIEEVVQEVLGSLQHQAMAEMREDYNQSAAVMKKASAEGDAFTANMARRRMVQIESILDGMDPHVAACAKMEKTAEGEDTAEDTETAEPAEAAPAEEADTAATAEATNADASAESGADAAAAGMAEGVAPQEMQIQIVQQAIQSLIDEGVDPAVIAQVVGEVQTGQVPDLTKVASAEDLANDPKLLSHVAIHMALTKAAEARG